MQIRGHWVHQIDPYLVHFPKSWPIGGIFWYGAAYLLSFLLIYCALIAYGKRGRLPFRSSEIGSFLFFLILGVILGGRLGYIILYEPAYVLRSPREIFCLWHGGMSSHGGFLGVSVALLLFSRRGNIPLLQLTDTLASLAPLGLFFGRIANFINGEIYGRVTTVPWAMIFPRSATSPSMPLFLLEPRHPSQLYEAFLEGLVLLIYCQWQFWRRRRGTPGRLTAQFLILYSLFRIFVEFFREPDADLIGCLTRGQFYSLFLLASGILLHRMLVRIRNENP